MNYDADEYRHADLAAWLEDTERRLAALHRRTDYPDDYLALCIGSREARRDDLRMLLNLPPIPYGDDE